MRTEYISEIKKLLQENFEPVQSTFAADEYTERKTLKEIYKFITNILPADWVYESDVYTILEELGFKSFMYTLPAQITEDGDIIPEKSFLYYFLNKKTAAI
ncbi:hypothetical protein SAMN04487764_1508 [Gillisia sp. Hel1_33_143]|uniref:hypothetical protein n=1 Tax=Gillisia sp. Hel1_33_143 TaxID=1336796 RepID=UPI00087A0B52|nr:hypothetical protein [Gillisia sp. Hel1_33_143]SDS12384.1 hypothetical protein SAMN04487764_1508 [Gillisia sp. Hel1_33_143]